MRKNYTAFPLDEPDPLSSATTMLWPALKIRVGYKHAQSPRFDAIVDSGSPLCIFKADIGKVIGLDVEKGIKGYIGGIVGTHREPVYFHKVRIYVEAIGVIEVPGAFGENLGVTGVLGRIGFFSNFHVVFDQSGVTPALEIERISRA